MEWANGIEMTDEEIKHIKMVRDAGCTCELPLLGYIPNQGPRCRFCNTESFANQSLDLIAKSCGKSI